MFEEYVYQLADYIMTTSIPVSLILGIALLTTFTENIFPPAPCDVILVILGSLIGLDKVAFIPLLISATFGSVLGFLLMFWFGSAFGKKIIKSKKFAFITEESLVKPTAWFNKWGYYLIVANRFLSGTRAVISFFAGLSKLSLNKTILLSAISALVWNGILIFLGWEFGRNWETVWKYMSSYGLVTLIILGLIIAAFATYKILKIRKAKTQS